MFRGLTKVNNVHHSNFVVLWFSWCWPDCKSESYPPPFGVSHIYSPTSRPNTVNRTTIYICHYLACQQCVAAILAPPFAKIASHSRKKSPESSLRPDFGTASTPESSL